MGVCLFVGKSLLTKLDHTIITVILDFNQYIYIYIYRYICYSAAISQYSQFTIRRAYKSYAIEKSILIKNIAFQLRSDMIKILRFYHYLNHYQTRNFGTT